MTPSAVPIDPFSVVAQAIRCPRDSLSMESAMYRDHGWDSFGHVGVILALEEVYSISIPNDEMMILITMKAIVLLSGGLDSTLLLAKALEKGRKCLALSFDYGQRHNVELDAAKRIAISLGITEHHIVPLEFWKMFGGSSSPSGPLPGLMNPFGMNKAPQQKKRKHKKYRKKKKR